MHFLVGFLVLIAFNAVLFLLIMRKHCNSSKSNLLPTSVGKETKQQRINRKENDQRFGK